MVDVIESVHHFRMRLGLLVAVGFCWKPQTVGGIGSVTKQPIILLPISIQWSEPHIPFRIYILYIYFLTIGQSNRKLVKLISCWRTNVLSPLTPHPSFLCLSTLSLAHNYLFYCLFFWRFLSISSYRGNARVWLNHTNQRKIKDAKSRAQILTWPTLSSLNAVKESSPICYKEQ